MSRNSNNRRRRRGEPAATATSKRLKPVDLAVRDETYIDSDDDEDEMEDGIHRRSRDGETSSSSDEEEDLATRKVRMAKAYLQRLEKNEASSSSSSSSSEEDEDDDDNDDRIGRRLQRQRLKREGTFQRDMADKVQGRLEQLRLRAGTSQTATTAVAPTAAPPLPQSQASWIEAGHVRLLRGHDLTPTAVALCPDTGAGGSATRAISGAKDHSVLLWDVEQGRKISTLCPSWRKQHRGGDHNVTHRQRTAGQVLAVASSDDGRYAAVGSRDATVRIFDVRSQQLVKTFQGHKGPVTDLAFRTNSLQLFSASADRCIRHYNLQEMMYMETLYGHQFGVTAIDCHHKERPVSVGRDRTARAWKLAEDTHLIFRGGSRIQNAESISMIKDDWFVTGHEDGTLSLWYTEKKKAVATVPFAHGAVTNSPGGLGRGVVSVRSLYGSDVCVTGSYDGYLRFWKVQTGPTTAERSLSPLSVQIPLEGYLNSIALGPKARFAVVAMGQEHRLGRWNPLKGAKNRLAIVKLSPDEWVDKEEGDGAEEDKEEDTIEDVIGKDPSESDGDSSSSSPSNSDQS